MNKKILTIIFGMILLAGSVFAVNNLTNMQGIDMPANVVGGKTFTANFSFDYVDNLENEDSSPLIIKLNMTSEDEGNYPVWKGDFEVKGYIEKTSFFGFWSKTVPFNCSDNETIDVNHERDRVIVNNTNNGTFYCYNKHLDLVLNEKDNVVLEITPKLALWPGTYNLTAQMYYLNDTTNPIVIILNKDYFNRYFRDGSYVDFEANISDGSNIQNYYARIEDEKNISFSKELVEDETYHFFQTLPIDITEGEHIVRVIAVDEYGNRAEDTSVIKIDLTAPTIELVSPDNNSVYDEMIPIRINVTDEKAGASYDEVYYRIREVKDGLGLCPESGEGFGNGTECYNSGWVNAPYSSDFNLNYDEFNSSVISEGEYWLEVKAQDILENFGVLE